MNLIHSIVITLVLLAVTGNARAALFTGLGDLPGGDFQSVPSTVSSEGTVVGRSYSGLGIEAFRWTSGGGMVGLGDFDDGSFDSQAMGVSANGSVVVGYGSTASGLEAFRWTSGGGMVSLGDLSGGGFYSEGFGVSADGSVVIGRSSSGGGFEAFRWTAGSGMVGLGDLAGGWFYSDATGVSADGSVVVGWSESGSGFEAFRWTSGGGMVGLGDLAGGSFQSRPFGASADGSVVVGYGMGASGLEAFRWTSGGGMVSLGAGYATGVSSDGLLVVGNGSFGPFIWDSVNGMRNLHDLLTIDYGLNLTGWTLSEATGISGNGRYVTGYGEHNGNFEAWMVDLQAASAVPEPTTAVLWLVGGMVLWRYRARKNPPTHESFGATQG
jgi:probable HAF family extracellular repeat protein